MMANSQIRELLRFVQINPEANLTVSLLAGGALALLVRILFKRYGQSVSNRDNFSAVFLPLTITTVLVISVVKSSLTLSLGLVGALSIVRFRAAIKDPEELTYLFLCIALGLALGAGVWPAAIIGFVVFSIYIMCSRFWRTKSIYESLMITISGQENDFFGVGEKRIDSILRECVGPNQIQRFECAEGRVQYRSSVQTRDSTAVFDGIAKLRERLPKCEVSYINLENLC